MQVNCTHSFDRRHDLPFVAQGQAVQCLDCRSFVVVNPKPEAVVAADVEARAWGIIVPIALDAGLHPCDKCREIYPERHVHTMTATA